MRAEYFLLAIGHPSDKVVQSIPCNSGQVVVSIKPSRIDRTQRVRASGNRPVCAVSTMSIDITPARIKTITNLQGLINTIIKNRLRVGVAGAAAFSLPLSGEDADAECGAAIFFVSP